MHTPVKGRSLDIENRSYNMLLTAAQRGNYCENVIRSSEKRDT